MFWLWSRLLALRQEQSRRERIAKAEEQLDKLQQQLIGSKARRRKHEAVADRVHAIVDGQGVGRWLVVTIQGTEEHRYRQATAGRPGPDTRYVRRTKRGWRLEWHVDESMIAYDRRSDGMYPLLTNDRTLTVSEAFAAHRRQPAIEKRSAQLETVFQITPVLLKNEARIEALFCVYFLAPLVQALIERELRKGMAAAGITDLPLYGEERACRRPTAEQIFRLFSHATRNVLLHRGREVRAFDPQLTDLQRDLLRLSGIPTAGAAAARLRPLERPPTPHWPHANCVNADASDRPVVGLSRDHIRTTGAPRNPRTLVGSPRKTRRSDGGRV